MDGGDKLRRSQGGIAGVVAGLVWILKKFRKICFRPFSPIVEEYRQSFPAIVAARRDPVKISTVSPFFGSSPCVALTVRAWPSIEVRVLIGGACFPGV